MLDLIATLVFSATAAILQTQLYPVAAYEIAKQPLVGAIEFKTRPDDSCRYKGVAVPYARDWDEEILRGESSKTVLAAEPDKIAGLAFIVYKKVCPGVPSESMLSTGSQNRSGLGFLRGVPPNASITVLSLAKELENQPKWMPQVLTIITKAAEAGNASAIEFVAETKAAAERAKLTANTAAK